MKLSRNLFILILTLLLFHIEANAQGNQNKINIQKLNNYFQKLATDNKIMGSFAIAENGKIIYKKTIGYSSVKNKLKINPSTKFRIASTTKLFTATLIFQLIDEGKLALDTKLSKFYPEIPNSEDITIEMLLNHKNGLYDYINDFEKEVKDQTLLTKYRGYDNIMAAIISKSPKHKPNEKTTYSNSGYYLLTQISKKITKKEYADLVKNNICKKINLNNTYSPTDNELKKNEARSYEFKDNKWIEMTELYFPDVIGVGNILSTNEDLITFNEALLNGKLISIESLKHMKTYSGEVFCTGMMEIPFFEYTGYGHAGDVIGSHNVLGTFENEKLSFAISINGGNISTNQVSIAILSAMFNKDYSLPNFDSVELADDILTEYEGIYENKDINVNISITRKGKKLVVQATGQDSFEFNAIDEQTFKSYEVGIELVFKKSEKEFLLKQGGKSFTFKKK